MSIKESKGWYYCITNTTYENDNIYKVGITLKIGLEEEIKSHILSRYGTTFIDPKIKCLHRISFPKIVEKKILEELNNYRHGKSEIVSADYETIIKPLIYKYVSIYPYDIPIYIEDTTFNIYVNKLQKIMKGIINDMCKHPPYYTRIEKLDNFLRDKFNNDERLNINNQNIVCRINNSLSQVRCGMSPYSSHNKYTIEQKNNRKNQACRILDELQSPLTQWDKRDPKIYKFLKDFTKCC